MNISFRCRTNKDYVRINTATFLLRNGSTVTVDRDQTLYDYDEETGNLSMTWEDVYLWEVNGFAVFDNPAYVNEDFTGLMKGCTFLSFDIEDDVDSDYEVTLVSCSL